MPSEEIEKGDKVSWNWGSGKPGGTVAETKKEGEIAITSKRGNKIKKNAEPDNPAVHVERSGNDVVKRASELNVEEKANGNTADADDKKEDAADKPEETTNGEKRKHNDEDEKKEDDKAEEKKDEPLEENADGKTVKAKEPAAKKQKKEPAKKEKGVPAKPAEEKKKPGRPPKAATSGGAKKQKKEPTPRSTDGIGSRTRSRG